MNGLDFGFNGDFGKKMMGLDKVDSYGRSDSQAHYGHDHADHEYCAIDDHHKYIDDPYTLDEYNYSEEIDFGYYDPKPEPVRAAPVIRAPPIVNNHSHNHVEEFSFGNPYEVQNDYAPQYSHQDNHEDDNRYNGPMFGGNLNKQERWGKDQREEREREEKMSMQKRERSNKEEQKRLRKQKKNRR